MSQNTSTVGHEGKQAIPKKPEMGIGGTITIMVVFYLIYAGIYKARRVLPNVWKFLLGLFAVIGSLILFAAVDDVFKLPHGISLILGAVLGFAPLLIKKVFNRSNFFPNASSPAQPSTPGTKEFFSISDINASVSKRNIAVGCWVVASIIAAAVGGMAAFSGVVIFGGVLVGVYCKKHSPRLMYSLDADAKRTWDQAIAEFASASHAQRIWVIHQSEHISDRKRNAGAHRNIKRSAAKFSNKKPNFIVTNVEPYCLSFGQSLILFMPDRLYLSHSNHYSAFDYPDVSIQTGTTRFIEDERVPSDAQVVDYAWQYTNKSGGPDKRFANNRQYPIARYGTFSIAFTSNNLSFEFQISHVESSDAFANAVKLLAHGMASSTPISTQAGEPQADAASQGDSGESGVETDSAPTASTIQRRVRKSMSGLIGLDDFTKQLSLDLQDFLVGNESRARLFWGEPGTGKTEFAQRLAGQRKGFPKLKLGDTEVTYVSGVDGKLEIKELVEKLPEKGIIFVDEADKCLDPAAGMVTKPEATQLQHAIVTHFSRKQLYWGFIGTFSSMRGTGKVTYEMLSKTLGAELASRVDFSDWALPNWTLESLLKAVGQSCTKRGLLYEDDALLSIAKYCLASGGAVRAFDNIDQALARRLVSEKSGSETPRVTLALADEQLARMGYKAVA